jgi:hypothetical protein
MKYSPAVCFIPEKCTAILHTKSGHSTLRYHQKGTFYLRTFLPFRYTLYRSRKQQPDGIAIAWTFHNAFNGTRFGPLDIVKLLASTVSRSSLGSRQTHNQYVPKSLSSGIRLLKRPVDQFLLSSTVIK